MASSSFKVIKMEEPICEIPGKELALNEKEFRKEGYGWKISSSTPMYHSRSERWQHLNRYMLEGVKRMNMGGRENLLYAAAYFKFISEHVFLNWKIQSRVVYDSVNDKIIKPDFLHPELWEIMSIFCVCLTQKMYIDQLAEMPIPDDIVDDGEKTEWEKQRCEDVGRLAYYGFRAMTYAILKNKTPPLEKSFYVQLNDLRYFFFHQVMYTWSMKNPDESMSIHCKIEQELPDPLPIYQGQKRWIFIQNSAHRQPADSRNWDVINKDLIFFDPYTPIDPKRIVLTDTFLHTPYVLSLQLY